MKYWIWYYFSFPLIIAIAHFLIMERWISTMGFSAHRADAPTVTRCSLKTIPLYYERIILGRIIRIFSICQKNGVLGQASAVIFANITIQKPSSLCCGIEFADDFGMYFCQVLLMACSVYTPGWRPCSKMKDAVLHVAPRCKNHLHEAPN